MSMQTPVIPSKFEFKITEFLYRDTVAATGRKRFLRVHLQAEVECGGKKEIVPKLWLYVTKVTDYQHNQGLVGVRHAYAHYTGTDPKGRAYKGEIRTLEPALAALVDKVLNRGKVIMNAFLEQQI